MRTSLKRIEQIEDHLLGTASTEDRLLFEARTVIDPQLAEETAWQKRTYGLIQSMGRSELVHEIEGIHVKLFSTPQYSWFREKVLKLFTK